MAAGEGEMGNQERRTGGGDLALAFLLTLLLIAVKAAGAVLSGSLALWADAGHSLTDVGAIGLSWFAWRQARRPPSASMTFGYARTEVLAALTNSVLLIVLAIWLGVEAVREWMRPAPVHPPVMVAAAALALIVNLVIARRLHGDPNVNARGVLVHVVTDAASSLGVLAAALIIALTGFVRADAVVTLLIAALMVAGTWSVMEETIGILMEATPPGVDGSELTRVLEHEPEVVRVHDLHIWRIGSGQTALACHVAVGSGLSMEERQDLLCRLHDALVPRGVHHVTIQLETPEESHREPVW
jgi:cobalt-zinc-cadmium efflux system protein